MQPQLLQCSLFGSALKDNTGTLTGTKCSISAADRSQTLAFVLQELHLLPVYFLGQFKVLVLTYKALCKQGPAYLKDLLHSESA